MVGLFVCCFFLTWKGKWALVAGAGVGKGRWFVLFQEEPIRTGNLGERLHLKRELYHGMPVVNALV